MLAAAVDAAAVVALLPAAAKPLTLRQRLPEMPRVPVMLQVPVVVRFARHVTQVVPDTLQQASRLRSGAVDHAPSLSHAGGFAPPVVFLSRGFGGR